jgi:enoyl-CoA hydratase
MEMALTGEPILAEEAGPLGLVNHLTEPGGALTTALEIAERIGQNAPLAVSISKQLIQATRGITEAEYWAAQEPYEAAILASSDAKEGPLAFAEKRAPRWTGA